MLCFSRLVFFSPNAPKGTRQIEETQATKQENATGSKKWQA